MMNANSGMQPGLQPMWANQAVVTSTGHVMGSVGHVISTQDHVIGSPGHVISTQDHVMGSPGHAPDHVMGSPGHVIAAKDHVNATDHVNGLGNNAGQRNKCRVEGNLGTDNGSGLCNTGAPLATPPGMEGRGPAQGFYSLLNNKELTSDPGLYQATPSCSIWTAPSCDQDSVQWPGQGNNSTQ